MIVRRNRGIEDGSLPFTSGPRGLFESAIIVAVVAMAVVTLGMTASWVWNSNAFRVSKIAVNGNEHVPSETVEILADITGQRLFTTDFSEAEHRIEQLAIVKDAEIERDWPGGVRVTITERQPWGQWEQSGERYAVDREGVILGNLPTPDDSPIIRSDETTRLEEGQHVDYQAITTAGMLFELLPAHLGKQVAEISYNRVDGVRVTTEDGQVAILGDSSGLAYKIDAWNAILNDPAAQDLSDSIIDLRYGNHPVLRAKGTP